QSQLYNCLVTVLAAPPSGEVAGGRRQAPEDGLLTPAARRPTPGARAGVRDDHGRGRVQVVEDNAVNQRVAVRMLQSSGYRVGARHVVACLARWSAQAEPGPPEEAVDARTLAALRDLQGEGQPDILAELIPIYLRETPLRLAALHEALARADAGALRREAHSL